MMFKKYIFKTVTTRGSRDAVWYGLIRHFLEHGMVQTRVSESGAVIYFRQPSLFFSSKRPLTCISELSMEAKSGREEVVVRFGVSFVKIRNFTIILMGFVWIGFPVISSLIRGTLPDFSPFGVLVIPLGVLVHYSVRGRVLRYLRKAVENMGENNEVR